MGEVGFGWDERAVLQEYEAASGVTQVKYTYSSELLSLTAVAGASRTRWFYAFDALLSPSELTDEHGVVQAAYGFDVWGTLFRGNDATPNRRLFTQHYLDTETGLQYFGARYYDARLGRFLTQDPYTGRTGEPPSLHRYAYAHGNPLRFVDPTGYAAEEPSLGSQLAEWGAGVGGGILKGIGSIVAVPVKSAVLGLTDIAQAGLGYLAIEASGRKNVDEIGALLSPVSPIGQLAAEKVNSGQGAWEAAGGAIRESATGIVRETVKGLATLASRTYQASMSGDPEKLGEALVEVALAFDQLKGPATAVAKPLLRKPGEFLTRADIALDLAMRQRISKRHTGFDKPPAHWVPGMKLELGRVTGGLTLRDAWEVAGLCVGKGVSGCSVLGGLSEKSLANLYRNTFETSRSLAMDERIALKGADGQTTGYKNPGDLDFAVHLTDPSRKVMNDYLGAQRMNRRMSAPMFDDYKGHGIMGEYFPDWMISPANKQIWWAQNGLPPGSPIRAVDYWSKGIVIGGRAQAPFYKNVANARSGYATVRGVDPYGNFEFVNPFEQPATRWSPVLSPQWRLQYAVSDAMTRAQQEK